MMVGGLEWQFGDAVIMVVGLGWQIGDDGMTVVRVGMMVWGFGIMVAGFGMAGKKLTRSWELCPIIALTLPDTLPDALEV